MADGTDRVAQPTAVAVAPAGIEVQSLANLLAAAQAPKQRQQLQLELRTPSPLVEAEARAQRGRAQFLVQSRLLAVELAQEKMLATQ